MSLPLGAEEQSCVTPALAPVLSARWALPWRHVGVVAGFCALFLLFDLLPVGDARVWLDLRHGRAILAHRMLPLADPAQPLAEGMPFVAAGWLTQVALAAAEACGGAQAVANLLAVLGLVWAIILARVFYLQSGRLSLALAGLAIAVTLAGSVLSPACPEMTGLACFAVLLWLVTRIERLEGDSPREVWLLGSAVAVLFAAWANLHNSFPVGVALVACLAAGRLAQQAIHTRSLMRALADRSVQRWILLAEAALVATLVNPYGASLWFDSPGSDLPGTLALSSLPAVLFLASLVALTLVFRHSRRRVQPAEIVLLAAFGAAVVLTGRALPWYGMVFVFVVAPHAGDWLAARARRGTDARPEPRRSFAASLICLLVIWCAFALSPASHGVLGGKRGLTSPGLYAAFPWSVAQYLSAHPGEGLTFAPVQWTDGLVWACPAEMGFMMTSDVNRAPLQVRMDYDRVSRARPGWDEILHRYHVDTLVIDRRSQPELAAAVGRSERWSIAFEDAAARVARPARMKVPKAAAGQDTCGAREPSNPSTPAPRRGVSL